MVIDLLWVVVLADQHALVSGKQKAPEGSGAYSKITQRENAQQFRATRSGCTPLAKLCYQRLLRQVSWLVMTLSRWNSPSQALPNGLDEFLLITDSSGGCSRFARDSLLLHIAGI